MINGGVDRIDTSFEELRADVQKKLSTAKSKEEYVSQCKSILQEIARRPDSDKFLGVHENVKTLFYDFTPELIMEVQESIEEERKKYTKKTLLQQKEEELSSLEAEARKISEAEAIIDQQKEGHDMGDE